MIDGDDGRNCFSPYHNPSKCEICQEHENSMKKEKRRRIPKDRKILIYSTSQNK